MSYRNDEDYTPWLRDFRLVDASGSVWYGYGSCVREAADELRRRGLAAGESLFTANGVDYV